MKFLRYEDIPVEALIRNPKNPREDVGDLTELIESIKQNGIYQELTVVPHGEKSVDKGWIPAYMIVIGHRRFAAAKAAGLEKVPCKVVYMSDREMQTTMLTENVQRSDLTPLEEAKGIQMCLDLGISKEAGMSRTKIRTRKVLLKYDPELVKKTFANGATIQDYLAAEKIEDENVRKKIIETFAGTDDFKDQIDFAVNQQKRNKIRDMIISRLDGYAVPIPKDMQSQKWNFDYVVHWSYSDDLKPEYIDTEIVKNIVGKREDPEDIFYYEADTYGIWVRCKRKNENRYIKSREQQEREERERKLESLFKEAISSRAKFIASLKNYTPANQHEQRKEAFLYFLNSTFEFNNTLDPDPKVLEHVIGKDVWKDREKFLKYIGDAFDNRPVYAAMLIEYLMREKQTARYRAYSWDLHFNETNAEKLAELYSWLEKFNYRISETEKQLINGTHPLYTKKEAEDAEQNT